MRNGIDHILASMFGLGLNGDAEGGIFGPNTNGIEPECELPTTVSSADEDTLYWSLYQATEDLAAAIQKDPVAKWALDHKKSFVKKLQEWLRVNNDPGTVLSRIDAKRLIKGLSSLHRRLGSSPEGLISTECLEAFTPAFKAAEELDAQPALGVLALDFTEVLGQREDLQDLLSEVKAAEEEYRQRVTSAIAELQISLGAEYGFEAEEKDGIKMLVQGDKSILIFGDVVDTDDEAELSDELFDEYVS